MKCPDITTLKIGAFSYSSGFYTVQPFGFKEDDTLFGLTAEKVAITALMTPDEWEGLLYCYDTWRTARLADDIEDIKTTVGSIVKVSMTANGINWTDVESYFLSAPAGEQLGAYVQTTVELVNAAQQVEIAARQESIEKTNIDYFGTFSLWGTELKLRQPPETYQDMPQMQLSAGGKSYVNGPTSATEVRALVGDTNLSGWQSIYQRCHDKAEAKPSVDWFPVSAPTASAEKRIVAGVRDDLYTVTINVAKPQT